MSGTQYTLRAINNSANFVDICVYQQDPNIGNPNVMSLAWFANPCWPGTTQNFRWTIDYSFVWSQTGQLVPGVIFDASQTWPADPAILTPGSATQAGDQLTFASMQGAYTFQPGQAVAAPTLGSLYILEQANIPLNQASVGIGMSGAGTFVVAAQPNQNLVFTPHPHYWITAGTYTQGQVLNTQVISNPAQVQFPPGVFSMTATLGQDNTWTVAPSSQLNFEAVAPDLEKRRLALVS